MAGPAANRTRRLLPEGAHERGPPVRRALAGRRRGAGGARAAA